MAVNIHEELITIERVTRFEEPDMPIREIREFIARVPARDGVYADRNGNELTVKIGPIDSSNNQKVIFGGDAIPTKKRRGKPGQFRQVEQPRRVVVFPATPFEPVRQEIGNNEQLLFRRQRNEQINL